MQEFSSINPSTGDTIWAGPIASADDVNAAVTAARRGLNAWSHTSLDERIAILERYKTLLESSRPHIAELIARESGKVLREANAEAGALIGKVGISIAAYHERTGSSQADMTAEITRAIQHRPIGIMAVFGPYNFPMHLPNGHIVPALLAGNCIIFKPSEETPACGELLVSLLHEAGVPKDILHIVHGAKDTGVALASHPDINGILFTGSYATGRAIHASLAGRPDVMLALEMGGNNPLIVYDAAPGDALAQMIIDSAYVTTGQRCTCARRLIVQRGSQGDAVIDAVANMIDRMIIGDAFADEPAYMGPLINKAQANNMMQAQAALLAQGARSIRTGSYITENTPFVTPGLLDITDSHEHQDNEIFAPLLQVIRVDDMPEAVNHANNTKYGLSAGLLSDNVSHWDYVQQHCRAGIVNFNRPLTGAAGTAPFGGPGCSGNFRPSAYYAADYCAYPMASLQSQSIVDLSLPGFRNT